MPEALWKKSLANITWHDAEASDKQMKFLVVTYLLPPYRVMKKDMRGHFMPGSIASEPWVVTDSDNRLVVWVVYVVRF